MKFQRLHLSWLVAALGALVSLFAFRSLRVREDEAVQLEFARRCQVTASVVEESLADHQEALYSLRNLMHFSMGTNRAAFAGIAREIISRHSGIQALEWVARVPGAQRAQVEAAVRAEGFPDFEFADRVNGPVLHRAPDRPEHFPILYIEPYVGNQAALGFDLISGITWKELQLAAAANRLVSSGRLPLITDGKSMGQGYLLELPVYRDPVPDRSETRPERLRGFVLGVFRISTVLEGSIQKLAPQGIDLLVIDRPDGRLLHFHPSRLEVAPAAVPSLDDFFRDPHHLMIPLPLANRSWELHFRPAPRWLATQRTWLPEAVGGGGLLGSLLLGIYFRTLLQRTAEVEKQVALRTNELHATTQLLQEDMAFRAEAETRLRESEARSQAILDYSPNAIFVKDLAGRYTFVSRQHALQWKRPAAEILGRKDTELFAPEIADNFRAGDRQVLAANAAISYEVTVNFPGASAPATAIVQKFPLHDEEGRTYGICGISTDISERKKAETELQESRRQLSNLISQLPGAAFRCLFDKDLSALFASEGMLALTGYPADEFTSGRIHFAGLTVPEDRPVVRAAVGAAVAAGRSFEVEYRIKPREGGEKWVLVRGHPVVDEAGALRFMEGLAIDITALKQAESEKLAFERNLQETQKLESLGVMAGGIAHDFNNILTAVLGNASLARMALKPSDPGQANLVQIEKAARRAADLCTQMLAYAGKGKTAVDPVDLSALVRDTTAMLEVSIRKNSTLTLQLADSLPPVLGDPAQLNQIVMNLVINAADAIGELASGKISVSTFVQQADANLFQTALRQPKLPAGTYVGLEVRDNGCGMAAETIARIFEPFFTTKFSGRGLGLSAVLGIVRGHHGALFVESQPGAGSAFRLLLPALDRTAAVAPPPPATDALRPLRGTVLIVDDEEDVRSVTGCLLRRQGLAVVLAADGSEALALFEPRRTAIDLVLLDLTMPGLSGEEVLRRLRQLNPRQKIVVMSGHGEEETMQRCAEFGKVGFLRKPFELETILAHLRQHIG